MKDKKGPDSLMHHSEIGGEDETPFSFLELLQDAHPSSVCQVERTGANEEDN
jgi:hypothetical protein